MNIHSSSLKLQMSPVNEIDSSIRQLPALRAMIKTSPFIPPAWHFIKGCVSPRLSHHPPRAARRQSWWQASGPCVPRALWIQKLVGA